jgi:hypothetical protein
VLCRPRRATGSGAGPSSRIESTESIFFGSEYLNYVEDDCVFYKCNYPTFVNKKEIKQSCDCLTSSFQFI